MDSITFSEFANIMFPYCGCGDTQSEFVITLTNKVMAGRPGRAIKEGNYKNPMINKEPRNLQNYFKGTRSISPGDASVILSSIDKYKFEEYLRHRCSEHALSLLKIDVYNHLSRENTDSTCDIVELCADLFVTILQKLATKETKDAKTEQK